MHDARVALVLALALASSLACLPGGRDRDDDDDEDPTPACEAGAVEACSCDGFESTRTCDDDGSWGACDCPVVTGCSIDDDCGETPATPKCNEEAGVCVACLGAGDCGGSEVCDTSSNRCVGCVEDNDCVAKGTGARCVQQACVQCTGDADCNGAACNEATNTCAECFESSDCRTGNRRHCIAARNQCVQCESDAQCSGATPACKSNVNQCVACTSDTHCSDTPSTPKCRTNTNSCVRCNVTADCGANEACQSNQCVSTVVSNDTCANPTTINVSSGTGTVTGTLADKANDSRGSCVGNGVDAVHRFTLTTTKSVAATVTGFAGIYITADCANTQEKACANSSNGTATVVARNLAPGTYFVWVDYLNASSVGQAYTLTLNLFDSSPATNESCSTAQTLQFDANGTARVSSTTTDANRDNYTSVCALSTAAGPDLVYTFKTTEVGSFTATLTPKPWSTLYQPLLQLRRGDCASTAPSNGRCSLANARGDATTLTDTTLEAGTWYLWVDGWAPTGGTAFGGDFDLVVNVSPNAFRGETCEAASPVVLRAGTVRTTGTTVGLANDHAGSCGGANEPDKAFEFQVEQSSNLIVTLANGSSTFRPVMYLKGSCSGGEYQCRAIDSPITAAPGSDLLLRASVSPGTTYKLIVDGYQGTSGDFSLIFTATPSNTSYSGADHCQSPASEGLITLTNGYGVGGGTPYGKQPRNMTTGCSVGGMGTNDWPDAMNYFYLPAGYSAVRITVSPRGTWLPIAQLTRASALGCGATHTDLGCGIGIFGNSSGDQPVFLGDVSSPEAGYYFIWVKGNPSFGGFSSEYAVSVIAE